MSKLPVYAIEDFEHQGEVLYANIFQDHVRQHPFVNQAHRHNFFLCVYFSGGNGVHEIDFETHEIRPGSVFILKPGQFHKWKTSDDAEGFVFFHSRDIYNRHYTSKRIERFPFFTQFRRQYAFMVPEPRRDYVHNLFREITNEFEAGAQYSEDAILSMLDLVYIELARELAPEGLAAVSVSPHYLQKMEKLEQLIEDHFIVEKSPAAYAGRMNVTEKHLNRIVRESIGRSLQQLISDRIILEAKRMLVNTGNPVSKIAEELGYTDVSYFTRLFRKYCHETPRDFRIRNARSVTGG